MQRLMKWVGSQGDWNCSGWNLPALAADTEASVQRWAVVAGGLALVLSRTEAPERSAHFAASHALYQVIRRDLRHGRPPAAGAALLGEAMHELAQVADPATRRCLMACFQDAVKHPGGVQAVAANQAWEPATTQAPASTGASRSASRQAAATSASSELLQERASSLRKTLAAARTGGAAPSSQVSRL
jgi:hypothetical protein